MGGGFELASLAVNQKRLPETDGTIFLAKNMHRVRLKQAKIWDLFFSKLYFFI